MAYTDINSHLSFYPTVTLRDSTIHLNFGATPFQSCPAGYTAIPYQSTAKRAAPKKRSMLALILEPTRELAQQTFALSMRLMTSYDCLMQYHSFMSNPSINVVSVLGAFYSRDW